LKKGNVLVDLDTMEGGGEQIVGIYKVLERVR